VKIYAFTCGWIRSSLGNFLEGAHGSIRVPVPCFLVDHPKGKVLFDTGMHVDTQHDPHGRLGYIADHYTVEFRPGEEVGARLRALGIDPAEIRWLVQSHLHFDHCGGNAQIPNATVVVQKREWEAGSDADMRQRMAYDARDFDLGHDVRVVDGEHDLFGDGRVVCVPTYGHTPGHQSLLLRSDAGEVVMAADACYLRRTLEQRHLPPVAFDPEGMRASLDRITELRAAGARVVFGHDPEDWEAVPQAPRPLLPSA
jgi:glyoxylase-like metal-dependent hydrolase (beta-lactamase superfamily II)